MPARCPVGYAVAVFSTPVVRAVRPDECEAQRKLIRGRAAMVYAWKDTMSVRIDANSSRVFAVCTQSPDDATAQGIRFGSSDLAVTALGPPEKLSRTPELNLVEMWFSGIHITELNGNVHAICVPF
jgi:hypothetical protein